MGISHHAAYLASRKVTQACRPALGHTPISASSQEDHTSFFQNERFDVDPNRLLQIAPWVALEAEQSRSSKSSALLNSLHDRLHEIGWKLTDLERLNHQSAARSQISFANTITSMRLMSVIDWVTFFEDHCVAELQLRLDPAEVYSLCDPSTRNVYRTSVEKLAKRTAFSDEEVAKIVVEMCSKHRRVYPGSPPIESHVGYWLLDKGLGQLENKLRYSPNTRERFVRRLQDSPYLAYFGVLGSLWFILTLLFGVPIAVSSATWLSALLLLLLSSVVLTELAMQIGNWWFTLAVPPNNIPKLELENGIPAKHPTIVVVPCLFGSVNEVHTMLGRLENHFLSNGIPGLTFALLTDFADAQTEETKNDVAILEAAEKKLAALNAKYATHGKGPFLILHRPRRFKPQEGKWIGWERKRGKLMEFGRWILGDDSIQYSLIAGDVEALNVFRSKDVEPFVITLDADTQLPHGTAIKLIGTLAHPLVRPVWNEDERRIERGYVVLQPRVSIDLSSRMNSDFAALHSSGAGVSPYVTAASDVYQDLFKEGSFTGKGIYDLRAFEHALHGAFPENAILSHDLIEGAHTRVAMTSDVEVFDGYPSRYDGDAKRIHRWVRGDWQIVPWLFSRVPSENGYRDNTINALSKWKIADNIRRSVVPPTIVGWVAGTAYLAPELMTICILAVLALFFVPALLHGVYGLCRTPRQINFLDHAKSVWEAFIHNCLLALSDLTFVAHKAHQMVDAIVRTIYRMKVSHRNLLQWQTAQAVEMQNKGSLASMVVYLWASPVVAIFIASIAQEPAIYYSLPLLTLWFFAPLVAYILSRKKINPIGNVNSIDERYLRRVARRTWSFFEAYATEDYNYLPPDNVQEIPDGRIASRISPTNEGLFLLAAMGARDCGFVSISQLIHIWNETWSSWRKLETYKGHYFNWYETSELKTLSPRYVSTVDSGNLAACLLAWQTCLHEVSEQPILHPKLLLGIGDTLDCLIEDLRKALYGTTEQTAGYDEHVRELLEETEIAKKLLDLSIEQHIKTIEGQIEVVDMSLDEWTQIGEILRKHILLPLEHWSLDVVSEWLRRKLTALRTAFQGFEMDLKWIESFRSQLAAKPLRTVTLRILKDLAENESSSVSESTQAILKLIDRLDQLQQDANKAFNEMDFKFLLNSKRKLFRIGYNADTDRFDRSHYDMLASESRLGSYVAIGKGDVPASHWFRLGRQSAYNAGSICLISWGGTMFEYLMPSLLQKHYEKSLLTETALAAIRKQQEYVRRRGIPWGISESAYASFNNLGDYLYQSFGVPGLGLKRGLARDLVIAPYATLLSLDLAPQKATDNLRRLEAIGALGPWGFYDAVDFTAGRAPSLSSPTVVRNYMAHHHGMSILAIINCIFEGKMQQRFSANSVAKSCELLLQEKYPTSVPRTEDLSQAWDEMPPTTVDDSLVVRRMERFDTIRPRTMLLSNGRMSLLMTHSGNNYSRWQNTMLSRWRASENGEGQGFLLYLKDSESEDVWSPTYEPLYESADESSTTFAIDKAEYRKRRHGIETLLDITISPDSDAEIRRLRITNHSSQIRRIEIVSYFELSISTQAADVAHPAFQKLFVSTDQFADRSALIAHKRSPSGRGEDVWVGQVVSHDSKSPIRFSYETSREKFIGRLRSLSNPQSLHQQWTDVVHAPIDPVFAFRCQIELAPDQTIHFAYTTVASKDKQQLSRQLTLYADFRAVLQTFELSWAHFQAELKGRRLDAKQSHLYQRMASYLLFPSNAIRRIDQNKTTASLNQSAWWRHSISGDLPVLLVAVDSIDQKPLMQELFAAHSYLQAMGLEFDLVIIDENAGSYFKPVLEMLQELQARVTLDPNKLGKSYVIPANTLTIDERSFFESSAAIYMDGKNGSLLQQLSAASEQEKNQQAALKAANSRVPVLVQNKQPRTVRTSLTDSIREWIPESASSSSVLDNGWGSVLQNESGYEIDLTNPNPVPAPWSLVLSNKSFGSIITEHGGGFTWYGNSRQFKLTAWSNDAVTDAPSEMLWLRDEETYEVFRPLRDADLVIYKAGVASFSSAYTELAVEADVWIDASLPLKFIRLSIVNNSSKARKLSATYFANPVLGDYRERTQSMLVSNVYTPLQSVLVRNASHEDYPNTSLMLTTNVADSSFSGSQLSFRQFATRLPVAMSHEQLDGQSGFGIEACAAIRGFVTAPPQSTTSICFAIAAVNEQCSPELIRQVVTSTKAVSESKIETIRYWQELSQPITIRTPNEAMNRLVNDWLLYQTIACRIFARSAFYQSGGAYGFRDQLQDAMAAVYSAPELTRELILKAASRQFVQGDVQHWWHEPSGKGTRTRFSDDRLFLPFVVLHYCQVTGDTSILDQQVPFLQSDLLRQDEHERYETPEVSDQTASLLEHCIRAIDISLACGPHDLPLMGCGDWNDGMNRIGIGGHGESVWLGWFLVKILEDCVSQLSNNLSHEKLNLYQDKALRLRDALERNAWDGDWYLRAYYDDGTKVGSRENQTCTIDLLSQAWAVFVQKNRSRSKHAFEEAVHHLVDHESRLIKLFAPPFDQDDKDPGYINCYLPGVRENGGQYTHAAIWLVQAAAEVGEHDLAMQLLDYLNPFLKSSTPASATRYRLEPYVMAADIYTNPDHEGRGGWSWYTGAAGWMYRLIVESILGLALRGETLCFSPRVPKDWSDYSIEMKVRSKKFKVEFVKEPLQTSPNDSQFFKVGDVIQLSAIPDGATIKVLLRE